MLSSQREHHTMSSCTNGDTGGNKLERVRDLRFISFSELFRSRIVSVGIYILTPALGFRTFVFDGVNNSSCLLSCLDLTALARKHFAAATFRFEER